MIDIIIAGLQAGAGATILKNVLGYFRVAMQDGELSPYELKRLGATLISNVLYSVTFILMGLPVEVAMGASLLTDTGVSAIKKK